MANKSENNGNGWVCLYRSITDWQHYGEPMVKIVFIDLLLHAAHKPCWSCGVRLAGGETLRSSQAIAADNKINKRTVLNALKTLEASGEIVRTKISQKLYKTHICKWSKFQGINLFSGANETPQSAPQSAPQTTIKQVNNNADVCIYTHTRTREEIVSDILSQRMAIETFCKNEGITVADCERLANEVVTEWELTGQIKNHSSLTDERTHLIAQMRIKAQAQREDGRLFTATFDERKAKFIAECKALITQGHNREQVIEFARYYSQPTLDGKRMIFETFKGWDTTTRFILNQRKQKAL